MAHEMIESDNGVYYKKAAWHHRGIVSAEEMTPLEAAEKGGFLWEVEQAPCLGVLEDGTTVEGLGFWMNVRKDTNTCLGIVKSRYHVLQNKEFIDTICSIAEDDKKLKVHSMGTFGGGSVIYASVQLDSFGVGLKKADVSHVYADFVNGHDGRYMYHAFPSAIRLVCANTVRFAVEAAGQPTDGRKKKKQAQDGVFFKHTPALGSRVVEARGAILGFKKRAEVFATQAEDLSNKVLKAQEVGLYFAKIYQAKFGRFMTTAKTKEEHRLLTRQENILGQWLCNYSQDEKQQSFGIQGTAWAAFNSVTQWADHQKTIRCSSEVDNDRAEHRHFGNMFGDSAKTKQLALSEALALL